MNISGEIHVHKTETPISSLPEIDEVTGEELVRVYVNGIPQRVTIDTLLENAGGGSGGQPTPVNSSEKFTNTDELYLYLGNEEGYDYGYIYAYVDGDWISTSLYGKGRDGRDGVDGAPGEDGEDGAPGENGADGEDGYSPSASVQQTATGAKISVTDKNGTTEATVTNGTATNEQVETYVNAWLDDHPEATTTVADKSITQAKMAFPVIECDLSPNLVNPDELISARFNSASGGRQTFNEGESYYNYWRMSGYIDVSDHVGEKVWTRNYQGHCFYTAAKTVINNSGYNNSAMSGNGTTEGITIPEGATYIVLSFFYKAGRVFTANFGEALLPYAPYGEISLPDACVGDDQIDGVLSLDKIDTDNLILPTIGTNLIDKTKMIKDKQISAAGVLSDAATSLRKWVVTDIKVKGNTKYLANVGSGANPGLVFFDSNGNVCGTVNDGYHAITSPAEAVSCAVNGSSYYNYPAHMEHGNFLVEGETLPDRIVNAKYYERNALAPYTAYQSVLHRMGECWQPHIKTVIGLYGDSNTYGIKGNGNTAQNPNCWANLFSAEVERKLSGTRRIYPFGDIGIWGCPEYNSWEAQLKRGVIKVPFYGTAISLVCVDWAGDPTIEYIVDNDDPVELTLTNAGYTWGNLEEGNHTLTIVVKAGTNSCIRYFAVEKSITVTNRGISGRNLSTINNDVGAVTDNIEIICSGTNNRGGGIATLEAERVLNLWEYRNRNTKVIYISPIPALDAIEEANEAWKTIPYVESFIAGREARQNREYISLYHEIKDYCAATGTDIASLYVDGLHLNDAGHKLVAKIVCRKLGLGDLTEETT